MVGNKCVMWQLMWNNQSIAITNVMVRFLDIYIYIYIYIYASSIRSNDYFAT